MRLIDADEIENKAVPMDSYDGFWSGTAVKLSVIRKSPTIDAVPVVRCRECKHHYWEQEPCHGKSVHYCKLPHMRGVEVFKEFFCYYGERKEGADHEL